MRAIAPVVDGCGDAHHQGRGEVPRDVVVLPARELALEHVHQHEVQLHPLQTHPSEGRQEAEVQNAGDDGTHQLTEGGTSRDVRVRVRGSCWIKFSEKSK